jgi:hypothetical protein
MYHEFVTHVQGILISYIQPIKYYFNSINIMRCKIDYQNLYTAWSIQSSNYRSLPVGIPRQPVKPI